MSAGFIFFAASTGAGIISADFCSGSFQGWGFSITELLEFWGQCMNQCTQTLCIRKSSPLSKIFQKQAQDLRDLCLDGWGKIERGDSFEEASADALFPDLIRGSALMFTCIGKKTFENRGGMRSQC